MMKGTLNLHELTLPKIPEYEGIQKQYLKQYDEEKIDMMENTQESGKSIDFEKMKQNLQVRTNDKGVDY